LDNTKKFLRRSQRHILKLKGMLKEQEESNKTQLEEKEEEITRLKNEKEDMKVDDEISKSFETIVHLKTQIEEAKRVEELLKNQINEKEESCHKLETEVVDLRKKVEKSNKFLNSSLILNEILESQRSPNDKSGLGYKEATHAEASTSKKHEVKDEEKVASQPSTKTRKVSKELSKKDIKKLPLHLKENGHQSKGMKVFFMVNVIHVMNMVTKLWNVDLMKGDIKKIYNTIRCWRCDQVGHIVVHCNTMRCYNCSGFGHKSQECWNTRRKSMMRTSHSMTRRRNEVRKGDIFEKMEAQSSSSEKQGHLQKWVKKTEQPEQNGSLKGGSSVSSTEAYVGDSGISHVHMQADLE
jgi:hypothetical protein